MPPPHPQLRPPPVAFRRNPIPHSALPIPNSPRPHPSFRRKPETTPPLLPSPTQPRAATNPIPEITQIKRITVQDQAATTIRGQWASATAGATRGLGATCCPWRFGGYVDSGVRRKDVRMGRGRGFRRSPERREDGEGGRVDSGVRRKDVRMGRGVTWIPAFAGKT